MCSSTRDLRNWERVSWKRWFYCLFFHCSLGKANTSGYKCFWVWAGDGDEILVKKRFDFNARLKFHEFLSPLRFYQQECSYLSLDKNGCLSGFYLKGLNRTLIKRENVGDEILRWKREDVQDWRLWLVYIIRFSIDKTFVPLTRANTVKRQKYLK